MDNTESYYEKQQRENKEIHSEKKDDKSNK